MPQQPPTTFRIEDLKARLKLEPKSRLFYPLAEELRKIDRLADAEKVLRDGLAVHAGYTSAWISLGRVLIEQAKNREAIGILQKASTLDPGNVVAARLLAEAYYALGDKVEAIKKYKLVRALLPVDDEINDLIAKLEIEIATTPAPAPVASAPAPLPEPVPKPPEAAPAIETPPAATTSVLAGEPVSERLADTERFVAEEPAVPLTPASVAGGAVTAVDVDAAMSGARFTASAPEYSEEIVPPRSEVVGEEQVAAEEQRDFPLEDFGQGIGTAPPIEPPATMVTPPAAEVQSAPSRPSGNVFDDTHPLGRQVVPEPAPLFGDEIEAQKEPEHPLATATMADLYARQGHVDQAREIYTQILDKEPENRDVKEKLESLPGDEVVAAMPAETKVEAPAPKKESVARLESWLTRVSRK